MDMSPAGATFVGHHEGFVPRYYLDPVGVGTIGTGFTWASAAFRAWWAKKRPGQKFGPGATMTRAEAAEVLILLMREEYGAAVNRFLGKTVAQHVFDAMASVTFNCGADTLSDRWAAAVKRGDINAAADLLKTTRVTAKKKRLAGLVSRRLDEAELLEQADYTIGRPAVDPMADGMLVRGERGEAVRQLQLDLQAVGIYADGIVDGIFGYGTEAAVMEFQRSVGLDDDGYAGKLTLAALKGAEPAPPVVVPEKPTPIPTPETITYEEPEMPATVGHNGGPPLTPDLSPVEATNKANKGGLGAAGGAGGIGAGIVYLWSLTSWFPAEWASDPQAIIILTGVFASVFGGVSAWISAYRAVDHRLVGPAS